MSCFIDSPHLGLIKPHCLHCAQPIDTQWNLVTVPAQRSRHCPQTLPLPLTHLQIVLTWCQRPQPEQGSTMTGCPSVELVLSQESASPVASDGGSPTTVPATVADGWRSASVINGRPAQLNHTLCVCTCLGRVVVKS